MANELLEFENGVRGIALNLDVREIGVVILGEFSEIEEGQTVKRTGEILSVPVGDGFLGRMVGALGEPLDGLGPIENTTERALEIQAPTVVQRQPVKEPMQTGIKAIDAMTAIGRGQRQLIIGDRQTGKTAIAIDTIINQKDNWASGDPTRQVRCVYVAIGQKGSTIAGVKQSLEEAGAMEYTTIVAAPASDPAGYKYISPYTGCAIGQHWMYGGKHVLIIFDDLSKQAEAYRAISLLLRRPPGREAYPGDVFYLHSRLLERCAKLSDELGAGSMTGLPIVETKANDISAYIPTNVISITDGQIFLETDLFNSGVRPAINVGLSVSRVGGAAQIKAMRKVAGQLKLSLSQFRDLEAFAAFASDLDAASRAQLDRGARLVELLKQPQYSPFPVEEQVVSIWAGTTGQLDDVPVEDIRRFESEFLDDLRRSNGGLLTSIRETKNLTDDNVTALKDAIDRFRRTFEVTGGKLLVSDEGAPAARRRRGEAGSRRQVRAPGPGRRGVGGAMAAQLRAVRARIRAVKSIAKITRAQELIASSRIVRAQQRTRAAEPYSRELTTAVEAVVSRSTTISHPMITEPESTTRAAVLILTSDGGFCGAYNANVLREASRLRQRNTDDGITTVNYVAGRKGIGWHRFRDLELEEQWSGFSTQPSYADAERMATALLDAFEKDTADGGVDEIYLVSTEFVSMLTQRPVVRRLLPMEIEEREGERPGGALPSYEFEPSTDIVLDALLPQYVASRIYYAMLEAAASELAARRRAMKAATDNANDLIDRLTREANNARQAEITQEISEIVGGANALAERTQGVSNDHDRDRRKRDRDRHWSRRPGHRPGRRRGVPGRGDAGDLLRAARRRHLRRRHQHADPRGRAAHRRQHGPRDLDAADRRPGPRRRGDLHRRPDLGAGRRRDQGARVQRRSATRSTCRRPR